jgi:glycogen phosphorylase
MSQSTETLEEGRVITSEELGKLMEESGKPAETLMHVVELIAKHFHTNVCSAYLLEPDRANLVLAATVNFGIICE